MIHEILFTGYENARPGRELCAALDLNLRELGHAIEAERRAGYPICACSAKDNHGYFLAANKSEMQRYCNSLRKRAGEIFKTRSACLLSMEDLPE